MREAAGDWCGVRVAGYDVVRIVLGLVLLTAAGLKGHQLATEPVPGTGLLTSRWFLIGVVEFELFFGLWLLFALYPRRTWQAALLCFSGFACVSLYKALSGEATCGCFGRVPVNPWYRFMLDTAAVTALLRWPPRGVYQLAWSENGTGPLSIRALGLMAAWLALGVPAAVAMGSYQAATISATRDIFGDSELVVLEPVEWVGNRFPLLKYIDIGKELYLGEWTVVLYRKGCPVCEESISAYERPRGRAEGRQVALIEVPPYGEVVSGTAELEPRRCSRGRLTPTKNWYVRAPCELLLRDGRVSAAR